LYTIVYLLDNKNKLHLFIVIYTINDMQSNAKCDLNLLYLYVHDCVLIIVKTGKSSLINIDNVSINLTSIHDTVIFITQSFCQTLTV
jgi:hypothetical protein